MRAFAVLVALALGATSVHAQPKRTGTEPNAAQRAELDKLQRELSALTSKQAYLAAVKVARKAYELQKKISGEDSIFTWQKKQMLASMLSSAGDAAAADRLFREMLKATEAEYGVDSKEALNALSPLLGPLWQTQNYDELAKLYLRQLDLHKKLEGEQSAGYISTLGAYASMLFNRNEYTAAVRMYEEQLRLQEAMLKGAPPDWGIAAVLQIMGSAQWTLGQHAKALQTWDRAVKVSLAAPGANVIQRTSTLYGIAMQLQFGGRADLAKPLLAQAKAIYEQEIQRLERDAPDDYMLDSMYGMLGYLYRQDEDYATAEAMFEKGIAKGVKRNGYSGYEMMLAELKRAQGKHREALALLEKSAAAMAKIAPASATFYNPTMADVLRELGEFKRAEQLIEQHRAFLAKTYGKSSTVYAMTEFSMALIYMASGKVREAEAMLTASLDHAERELQNVLKGGTEADHAAYFARNNYQLDSALNFHINYAAKSASAARLALTTLLRRKGRVLDAAAASLATIRAKLSPDDKKLLDELSSARGKLAKLTVAGTGADPDAAKEIAALEDQIQKLEMEVGKKSAAYRTVNQPIALAGVQKLIPRDARLVEIVSFQPGDPKAPYTLRPKLAPRRYAAFVVGTTGDPVLVDLAEVAVIDVAVEKLRKALADPDNDRAPELGRAVFDLTMAKLIPRLGGATSVLVAPDGALNLIPFSALVDDKQQFLIKRFTFTYLTSGRDLLRVTARTKAQGGGVIFADPSFDATGKPAAAQPATRGRRSADLASLSWQPLPGTGQEADAVVRTMKNLTVYRGADATEGAIKQVHGPRVLHLATHGFFLPDEPPPPPSPSGGDARQGGPQLAQPQQENPLLRSGLAFAGANKLSSGDEDGILTALEASTLDLTGTKLVVLSACETGIGKVTNGEGVYGLRRALVIAGAESMVMTLWQVDDAATKDLMTGYYVKLASGKARSSALRDVQLEIAGQTRYAHPYYWASFVPAGDNSPLKD
jgi:CHAT domain-containing protein